MSMKNTPFKPYIFVTNRQLSVRPFLSQIEVICRAHPRAIVLREKDLPEEEYWELAKPVLKICADHAVPCILHNYWQVAVKYAEAGLPLVGIHLSPPKLREMRAANAESESEPEVKSAVQSSTSFLIGCSIHAPEESAEAEKLGASYLFAGHIYATECKKGLPPRGTGFLRDVCRAVHIPVYAIGGIRLNDPEQLQEILDSGAAGGAVMSACMRM